MPSPSLPNLRIDPERLWGDLMETAKIGGTAKGGICRLTLTDNSADELNNNDLIRQFYLGV